MQKIFFSVVSVAALLIGCGVNTANFTPTNTSSWTIGTTSYTGPTVTRSGNNQLTGDDGTNAMHIYFASIPSASGSYLIVNQTKAVNNTLASNECCFEFDKGALDVYLSTGLPLDTAFVTVSGGKIAVTATHLRVVHYAGGPALDSTYATGAYYQ